MLKIKEGFTGERSIILPPMVVDMELADPLVSSLYITDIGYYPKATHHFRNRQTAIDSNVHIYCVEGAGWYSIDGGKQQTVSANQYLYYRQGRLIYMLPMKTIHGQYIGCISVERRQRYMQRALNIRKMYYPTSTHA